MFFEKYLDDKSDVFVMFFGKYLDEKVMFLWCFLKSTWMIKVMFLWCFLESTWRKSDVLWFKASDGCCFLMFLWCFSDVFLMFLWCFSDVFVMFFWCFFDVFCSEKHHLMFFPFRKRTFTFQMLEDFGNVTKSCVDFSICFVYVFYCLFSILLCLVFYFV